MVQKLSKKQFWKEIHHNRDLELSESFEIRFDFCLIYFILWFYELSLIGPTLVISFKLMLIDP